jgi:hypothetical protein
MLGYIKAIEKRLSEDEKNALKGIYEPRVVCAPPNDSRRDVMMMPDGEIRVYGKTVDLTPCYLSSTDGGVSYVTRYHHSKMGSCTYFEEPKLYIGAHQCSIDGKWHVTVMRSKIGPDDQNPETVILGPGQDTFNPIKSAFSNRIWFTYQTGETRDDCVFAYSDDWGESWVSKTIVREAKHQTIYPHKGARWRVGSGTEPYVVELCENNLMMIIRCSTDEFYKSYSYDNGENWTTPEPSTFYGSNTTAFMLRLSDGRVLTFWNNTKPLPMFNYKTYLDGKNSLDEFGEAGFTNRDAAHAAISDDGGVTFKGYREILLNPARNNPDFRYLGGREHSNDKSVHQFQAFELPFNKVLVSAGQNLPSCRMVIFDLDWLYETSREETFIQGLSNVSTHVYVKSLYGHTPENGHCAYNRTNGAILLPSPDRAPYDVLYVSKYRDERLVSEVQGVTYNFPMSKDGEVEVGVFMVEKDMRICLCDRWFNPCDPTIPQSANFFFELNKADLGDGFKTVKIKYDTENEYAQVFIEDELFFGVNMTKECPTGISYITVQCASDGESKGFYVNKIKKVC